LTYSIRVRYGRFFAAVAVILNVGLAGSSAAAQTLSVSQKVEIRAVVAPARYVIVNDSGKILEIGGNTDQDVTPQVYRNKIAAANLIPLEKTVYQNYRSLTMAAGERPGILYKASVVSVEINHIKMLDLLSI
jgi:hypothetical protein